MSGYVSAPKSEEDQATQGSESKETVSEVKTQVSESKETVSEVKQEKDALASEATEIKTENANNDPNTNNNHGVQIKKEPEDPTLPKEIENKTETEGKIKDEDIKQEGATDPVTIKQEPV